MNDRIKRFASKYKLHQDCSNYNNNWKHYFYVENSSIHGKGVFMKNNIKCNSNFFMNECFPKFNDIHLTKCLDKFLGPNTTKDPELFTEWQVIPPRFIDFLNMKNYDDFIDLYLSDAATCDIVLIKGGYKYIGNKNVGEELFRVYGLEYWLVMYYNALTFISIPEDIKVHPLTCIINKLLDESDIFKYNFQTIKNTTINGHMKYIKNNRMEPWSNITSYKIIKENIPNKNRFDYVSSVIFIISFLLFVISKII